MRARRERAWMVLSRRAMHSVRPPPLALVRLGSRSPDMTFTVSGLPAMCLHRTHVPNHMRITRMGMHTPNTHFPATYSKPVTRVLITLKACARQEAMQ